MFQLMHLAEDAPVYQSHQKNLLIIEEFQAMENDNPAGG